MELGVWCLQLHNVHDTFSCIFLGNTKGHVGIQKEDDNEGINENELKIF